MIEELAKYASDRAASAQPTAQPTRNADKGKPSPRVKTHKDIFSLKCFKGGNLGNHAGDAIGMLWLLGKLDDPRVDETRLLNAARAWWHGRGEVFGELRCKTGSFERASRSSSSTAKASRAERDFRFYSSMLLDAKEHDRDCLESLMEVTLDGDLPSWVSRIVQTELLKFVRVPLVELARPEDYDKLEAAKRALMAMAGAEALIDKRAA